MQQYTLYRRETNCYFRRSIFFLATHCDAVHAAVTLSE